MKQINRREFVKWAGATLAGGTIAMHMLSAERTYAAEEVVYSGSDLSNWEVVLGDGLWAAPGQAWPNAADIATNHSGGYSELQANIQQRGVMAHNITFKRIVDTAAFDFVHSGRMQFRMPQVPSTGNAAFNAQTLEAAFFIWDGANTRKDYGLAFQWILNPWMSTFGDIRCWTDTNGGEWAPSGYLLPDTVWHEFEIAFDYHNSSTSLLIDGVSFLSSFSATPKPESWGTETAARFQAEIISLWPGNNQTAPIHQAQFRNWEWKWMANSTNT